MRIYLVLLAITTSLAADQFHQEMQKINQSMHQEMSSVPFTDNPDRDFAAMMIPHHKSAIEMAKLELLYGKDPIMRRMAQEIIVDQQSEIDLMNRWLNE